MKRLGFLSLLIAVSAIAARRPCRYRQRGYCKGEFAVALRYLDTSTPSPGVVDPCTAFSSELVAPSFCLRGDGTSTNSTGMALSAVGSPTTQTMAWCGSGLSCGNVSRQVVSASNYFQTASMAQPSGSWWACVRGIVDAPLPTDGRYIGQNNSWGVGVTSAGAARVLVIGGTTVSSSTGAVVGGASQLACVWFHRVASGSNVVTLYLDGQQVAQNSTEPDLASVTTPITAGQSNSNAISRLGFAMFGTGDPSPTLFSRLAAATAPTPQGTRGEQLTFSRNSLASCTAPDGSVTWLQPGRPCVSGGLRVRPAVTNLLTYSEQFQQTGQWTNTTTTITADQTAAPDGSTTADKFVPAGVGSNVRSGPASITANGGAYTVAASVKGTAAVNTNLRLFDATSSATLCTASTSSAVGAWKRLSCSVASTTSGHLIYEVIDPDTTAGTNALYAWGAQLETGSVASDYCRSESTSATCAAETASVPMPSSASASAGCAKACINPMWSGAEPYSSGHFYLAANNTSTARLIQTPAGAQTASISDSTNFANMNTTFTAGTKRCYIAKWDSTGATMTGLQGETPASSASLRLGAFGATLNIGNSGANSNFAAATISDIQLGASAGACN